MQIELTSKFIKSHKKLVSGRPEVAVSVLQKVLLFSRQPNSPSLGLHKLKGDLKDSWAFSLENDLRIIVDLKSPNKVLLIDIGTHDKLY